MPAALAAVERLRQGADPYAQVQAAQELLDVVSPRRIYFDIENADQIANVAQELVSPVTGFIRRLVTIVQLAPTTGGTIQAQVGTTNVTGLVITVANGAAAGTIQTDTPTSPTDGTDLVLKDGRIRLVLTGFATAGRTRGFVEIEPR